MKISIWKTIWNYLTGGKSKVFTYIVDIALNALNSWLAQPQISEKVDQTRTKVKTTLDVLIKYSDWCPVPWREAFDATIKAVVVVEQIFADNKVTQAEITVAVEEFQKAYAKWMADNV